MVWLLRAEDQEYGIPYGGIRGRQGLLEVTREGVYSYSSAGRMLALQAQSHEPDVVVHCNPSAQKMKDKRQ